jgi:hypothetical protein
MEPLLNIFIHIFLFNNKSPLIEAKLIFQDVPIQTRNTSKFQHITHNYSIISRSSFNLTRSVQPHQFTRFCPLTNPEMVEVTSWQCCSVNQPYIPPRLRLYIFPKIPHLTNPRSVPRQTKSSPPTEITGPTASPRNVKARTAAITAAMAASTLMQMESL